MRAERLSMRTKKSTKSSRWTYKPNRIRLKKKSGRCNHRSKACKILSMNSKKRTLNMSLRCQKLKKKSPCISSTRNSLIWSPSPQRTKSLWIKSKETTWKWWESSKKTKMVITTKDRQLPITIPISAVVDLASMTPHSWLNRRRSSTKTRESQIQS